MAALDFNGTGLNTSEVRATGQPGFTTQASTMCALILPDSTGQGGFGQVLSTGTSANAIRRSLLIGTGNMIRFQVSRATTQTQFIANTRAVALSGALTAKAACFVAATFDGAASPVCHIYTTGDGTNQGELVECGYSTTTAGTGTINTDGSGTARYIVGNSAPGGATFDGGIIWAAFIPQVLTLNELQALAAGLFPPAVIGEIANARCVYLGNDDGNPLDLIDPTVTWTATATTPTDIPVGPAMGLSGPFAGFGARNGLTRR